MSFLFHKKAKRKSDQPDELDRETRIADMNIEGMPWHVGGLADRFKAGNKKNHPIEKSDKGSPGSPPLSGKETWSLIINAVVAALVIALIFMGAVLLFILFCIYVWFK